MAQPMLLKIYLIFAICFIANTNGDSDDVLDSLLVRMEQLELSDAANKLKIGEMERREENLIRELSELKSKLELRNSDYVKQLDNDADTDMSKVFDNPSTRARTNARKKSQHGNVRGVPENEVAFYATHSQHDIQHLGANQVLIFDQVVTNNANGYNNFSGIFVSPVAGTYVFHATVMGRDVHNVTAFKYSAHLHVDGVVYSRMYSDKYDQASQMLVIDLNAGQSVSVRNGHIDEGFIGQHYSTFSGFLLYEHYTAGAIVGK